jgi:hypothetical protein|tara:strand:+ start:143 stop:550 length:408 start_codon:yes stop_codon:yes gene_type:complete
MAFNSKLQFTIIPVSADLDGTAGDDFTFKVNHPIVVHRLEFVVQTAVVATSTAPVVSLDYTDTVNSVARAEKVTLTVPNTTAAGITIEADLTPFFVADTDILHFERKTQGAGGTTAGDGFFILYYEIIPDSNGVA